MTMKAYNWGILGTGNIAHKFTRALMLLDNAHLYAVGSRDMEKAAGFAAEFGVHEAFWKLRRDAGRPRGGDSLHFFASLASS